MLNALACFSWKVVGGSSAWTCLNSIREPPLTHGALRQPRQYISTTTLKQAMLLLQLHGVLRSAVPFDERAGDRLQ